MNKNIQYVKEAKSVIGLMPICRKRGQAAFELEPTREPVSLRIPGITMEKIRRLANRRGISYQSLIASWLGPGTGRGRNESRMTRAVVFAACSRTGHDGLGGGLAVCHCCCSAVVGNKLV